MNPQSWTASTPHPRKGMPPVLLRRLKTVGRAAVRQGVAGREYFSWKSQAINQPGVIVCERRGHWAAALRRELSSDVRLRETRSLAECAAALAAAPTSVLALELVPRNLAGVLELVGEMASRFPQARAVILADHAMQSCEGPLREAGALHFVASPRELAGLGRTVRNHLASLPSVQAGFAEAVWEALPWGDVSTV